MTSEEIAGQTIDWLTEDSIGLRIGVSRTGAEMISLARRDASGQWRGFLHRDGDLAKPATGWGNHATVMGYFLHRLVNEQSTYRGQTIRGGNHGFLRAFSFDEPTRTENSLTYHVTVDRIPPDAYPFRVALNLTYSVSERGVTVTFAFENHESVDAHVSFGLHPGFVVSSLATSDLLFPQGTYQRHWAPGNFLDGRIETILFTGGPMPFDKTALEGSYLIELASVPDRTFVLTDPPANRRVTFDFAEVPFLTLWSDSDTFLCVEPCWGLPDSIPQKPFDQKIGIQVIPPTSTLTRGFTILPEIAS